MGDAILGHGMAIGLALLGAVCFAVASALQHHVVTSGDARPALRPARGRAGEIEGDFLDTAEDEELEILPGERARALSMRRLGEIVRHPRWLAGLGLAGAGSLTHAIALLLAPLRIVQPVGVLAVPIAVLISSARSRTRPTNGVLAGAVLSIAGVVVFVAFSAGTAASHSPPEAATLIAGLAVTGVVALFAAIGLARSGWSRCVALATAGATAFGLVSALVRAVSQSVVAGDVGLLDPPVAGAAAGVVAAFLVGGWLVQQAYAAGAPEVVIACLTVVDPIVAVLLGAVLLGEGAATPLHTWVLLGGAALAATAGVMTLAHHHPDAVAARAARTPALRGKTL